MAQLTETEAWQALKKHQADLKSASLRELCAQPQRFERYSLRAGHCLLDFSRHFLTEETLPLLCRLATEADVHGVFEKVMAGQWLNQTEAAKVAYPAQRCQFAPASYSAQHQAEVTALHQKMTELSERLRAGQWLGATGKPIRHIVNLGIGGSDLGPKALYHALSHLASAELNYHFVSNLDAREIKQLQSMLNPEETLFLVTSKSFSTAETLANAELAKAWVQEALDNTKPHFIAITANQEAARAWGIQQENILPMFPWVGGRFSLWSAASFIVACSVGMTHFQECLRGAADMDTHFASAPLCENMPVILGLLSIWYNNFWQADNQGLFVYDYPLRHFPSHIQQVSMESNGKTTGLSGERVAYATAPVLWGGIGNTAQHSTMQLLHQGSRFVPVDFVICADSAGNTAVAQAELFAHCLSQATVLAEGHAHDEATHRHIPGNKPSSILILDNSSPQAIGELFALYEHKTFVEGLIWQINSFDQYGVEGGKVLAKALSAMPPSDWMRRAGIAKHFFSQGKGTCDE